MKTHETASGEGSSGTLSEENGTLVAEEKAGSVTVLVRHAPVTIQVKGANLIDTAPGYADGYSEAIVGSALRGRREGMFVIDKVDDLEKPAGRQVSSRRFQPAAL